MATSSDTTDLDALLADPRAAFRFRVLRAAQRAVAQSGLGVSMDVIAEEAGVGRRSLFRHFDGRDELVAEALGQALERYGRYVDRTLADDATPLGPWLVALVERSHRAHLDAGAGLWQLAAADDADLAAPLAAVNRRRRQARAVWTASLARAAWKRAGGRGRCPAVVEDAVGLTMSSFATRSMVEDLGRDPAAVARHSADLLGALLEAHVPRARR